ncbi:MAG: hypothetical protein ABI969_02915 [bacterium]
MTTLRPGQFVHHDGATEAVCQNVIATSWLMYLLRMMPYHNPFVIGRAMAFLRDVPAER